MHHTYVHARSKFEPVSSACYIKDRHDERSAEEADGRSLAGGSGRLAALEPPEVAMMGDKTRRRRR